MFMCIVTDILLEVFSCHILGGFAEVVSTSGGHFISTFTFPNISAELLNNTLLTCADIDANENNETFYMAGNEYIYT